jgi:hypothetical protein
VFRRFNYFISKREGDNMWRMLIFLILLTFVFPAYGANIYKWVDEKGVVNFTDDYNKIPPSYRDRVEVREYIEEGGSPLHTLEAPPTVATKPKEEVRTDIYGRDETWWREKVRPWKEQLKKATENYEMAHHKLMEKAENLGSVWKYSRGYYRVNVLEIDRLKEEMAKYDAQIAEAKEQLEKLSKEAEESKADPDWLR